jgi:hypothetical protein
LERSTVQISYQRLSKPVSSQLSGWVASGRIMAQRTLNARRTKNCPPDVSSMPPSFAGCSRPALYALEMKSPPSSVNSSNSLLISLGGLEPDSKAATAF